MKSDVSIIVYGAEWCADCHRAKRLMDDHKIEYIYFDIDKLSDKKAEMFKLNGDKNTVPTIKIGDKILLEPTNEQLLEALDLKPTTTAADIQTHDVIMIGAGPAALTAAIYTTREDIDTLMFERGVVGGLAAVTDMIDNYPGFPDGFSGYKEV